MKLAMAFFVVAASVVCQWLLPKADLADYLRLDLVLIAVVAISGRRSGIESLALAAAAGLMDDVMSSLPVGTRAASLGLTAYVVARLAESLHPENFVGRLGAMAAGAVSVAVLQTLWLGLAGRPTVVWPEAIWATIVVGVLVLPALTAEQRRRPAW